MWIGLLVLVGNIIGAVGKWECPRVVNVSCSCDLPQTLRCRGPSTALASIAEALRFLPDSQTVSLLDCTVQHLTALSAPVLQDVALHGLVITSGELTDVDEEAFLGLKKPLQALGLPNNKFSVVPTKALLHLPALSRLDLSHNTLYSLHNQTFQGLTTLRFLDLSANQIRFVNSSTFSQLTKLKVLRLQSNSLTMEVVSKLRGLINLEELDLSSNSISGPLSPTTLPRLPSLTSLSLAHNQISSVTKGALNGLDSLKSLSLRHNMIDVLEDHAFRELPGLVELDLGHNRMVAVSEASLAHLNGLKTLDVSHNFLRALTADLVTPLHSLKELKLDDNDISMVARDALACAKNLLRLTLSENPLNCDCSLTSFAEWLRNSSIPQKDKVTAVCATPPSLANGLVQELAPGELVCEQPEYSPVTNGRHPMPVSGTRVTLRGFNYNGEKISLLWGVDTMTSYYCDLLFVYEELGSHEVLLESNRLHCNSASLEDPRSLSLSFDAPHMQSGHRYRYCLVMVERSSTGESSLVLGCSEVLTLSEQLTPLITSLEANIVSPNVLFIHAKTWPKTQDCILTVHVSTSSKTIEQIRLNCSSSQAQIKGLQEQGPFKVCASIAELPPYCIWTKINYKAVVHTHPSLLFFLFCLIISFVIITFLALFRWMRKLLKRPKLHEQCFLPSQQNEQQHSRYVKLQATTKL